MKKRQPFVKLPFHIRPRAYRLMVKPDLNSFTFHGEETIFLNLAKPSAEIILHAKELKVWDVELKIKGLRLSGKSIKYDTKNETVTINFGKKLPKGEGELSLKFNGVLNDKMRGFYRSRYTHNGRNKHLATTQFEATDARRAFPCFDEPEQKAVFDVTIMVPPGLTAISNTVETAVAEHESGYKIVRFQPTPKMSTYLLAFIVGEFEYLEGRTTRGVKVRVFVTPGKKHQARFALECGIKVLDFYEKYFDILYPLPVLDMIAIPDFSHGAMENWGAVTYRESALLVDEEHSSSANKQWVALVIAHELAHQWFGNLVTMKWWTHLWLNEGFASYIEYLAVDKLFPSWDIWTQFANNDLGVALKLDGLKNTHPIEVEVRHPDEIGEIFDEVSYSKGASVIRMLAGFLGEKAFRDGLSHYLKKHAYGNTSTEDLWAAFEKISKKPVAKIMDGWTKQAGYPLVRIKMGVNRITLSQSRFFSSPISKKSFKQNVLWQIPITVKVKNGAKSFLMDKRTMDMPAGPKNEFKLNFGEGGFFRTTYPQSILGKLKTQVAAKKLPAIDRLGIIRDAFALAQSQDAEITAALELAEAYKEETDYTVWEEICVGLLSTRSLIFGQRCQKAFDAFALRILRSETKKLGWTAQKNESHTRGLLRSLLLKTAGGFGYDEVISRAKILFHKTKPKPDIRGAVYVLSAEHGGQKEYKRLLSLYRQAGLSEEKSRIGGALSKFKDRQILSKVLKFALSEEVRLQDAPAIIAGVLANPLGRKPGFAFVKSNWKELNRRYPSSGHMLGRIIKPLGGTVLRREIKDLARFFKSKPAPGLGRTVEQILERANANALWLENQGPKLEKWLKARAL